MSDAPQTWEDFSKGLSKNPYAYPYHFVRVGGWLAGQLGYLIERSGWMRLLRGVEAIGILLAIVLFLGEIEDRTAERHNRAWSLVAAAATAQPDQEITPSDQTSGSGYQLGNLGLVGALEVLNNDGVKLHNVQLPTTSLVGVRLPGAQFEGANLHGSILEGADLTGANLKEAKLNRANLTKATLSGANLVRAEFKDAWLNEASLIGARLDNAILDGAELARADLSGAELFGAQLRGARLFDADLSAADFFGAKLGRAILTGVNLRGASLRSADLLEVDLRRADLSNADLTRTILYRANLSDARGLTQNQIDAACGDGRTDVPIGFRPPTPAPCMEWPLDEDFVERQSP